MVDDFLITLLWMVVNLSLIVTRALHVRGISGKVTFPGITSSIGHKYGPTSGRQRSRIYVVNLAQSGRRQ